MPLVNPITETAFWDTSVTLNRAVKILGEPDERINGIIAAQRDVDKASFLLIATHSALYLQRSKTSVDRVPWNNVMFFFDGSQENVRHFELILAGSRRTLTHPLPSSVVERSRFQIVRNNHNNQIDEFFRTWSTAIGKLIVHTETIDVLPGISPTLNWRIFGQNVQLIQVFDIKIDNPTDEERSAMNAVIQNRIRELTPRFAEIEDSIARDSAEWRTLGDPEGIIDRGQLQPGASLPNSLLVGEDLSFTDLSGANLEGSNLSDCDLRFTSFHSANLKGVNLHNSDLRGAILFSCNLENTDLSCANLAWSTASGANLREANLTEADLRSCLLDHSNLLNANLTAAKIGYIKPDKEIRRGRRKTRYPLAASDDIHGTYLLGAVLENAVLPEA